MKKKTLFLLIVTLILTLSLVGTTFAQGRHPNYPVQETKQQYGNRKIDSYNYITESKNINSNNSAIISHPGADYQFPGNVPADVSKYAEINQEGTGNEAVIVQTGNWSSGEQSRAYIYQDGKDNYGEIIQREENNVAEIKQEGNGHYAHIEQTSKHNVAVLWQLSETQSFSYSITQNGEGEKIKIIQN